MNNLSARNLSFSYNSATPILCDLEFQASPGQILGLAGANGSGKSTLINILAGLVRPSSGELGLGELRGQQAEKALRRQAALLPQNVDHWLLGETAREDLELGLDLTVEENSALLAELIARWGLTDILDLPVEALSVGQKKGWPWPPPWPAGLWCCSWTNP